jgi:serine/threonine-protein kinase
MKPTQALDQEATVLAQKAPETPAKDMDTTPAESARRPMVLVQGSGQHFTAEIHELLRRRLRVACSLALFGLGAFLALNLLSPRTDAFGFDAFDHALHVGLVALLTFFTAALWTSYSFSHTVLRTSELIIFGSIGLFFADMQFRVFYPGKVFEFGLATEEGLPAMLELANSANLTRWFFLIVLYGMFIPNTWKRCAVVVGCMAMTPIVLSFVACSHCQIMGPQSERILPSTLIVLSFSSLMAIFGSYKISELHEEAFRARKLGQYQLKRKLGQGGMGEVHLGEHTLLKRLCAIKLIRPEQAGDPKTLSRFEREVQAMATLTHWNTVEVYDYGRTEDGTFYYVMEYLPGLSLQELIEQHGPLPAGRAIHFLRQICAALKEAHSVGLIHRDIKPSNLIACERGGVFDVAKLLDFGLVHDICGIASDGQQQLTMVGAILGSPNYLSPEQASGRSDVDARTDIYSVGALAYFLVTGQTPFVRDTAMELLAAHMKDEPISPRQLRPEIAQDLEEVILMCLRKNPDERFPDAESLDMALATCDAVGDWDAERAADWWRDNEQK